jgi:sec-independent protein translocase protein TatC
VADSDTPTLLTRSNCGLLVTNPLEGFGLRTTIALYGGIALAMPVILWQAWRFIAPGLYKHERRYAVPFVVLGAVLFALGSALAYWTIPKALDFLISIGGPDLITVYSAKPYLSLIIKMMVAFGLGFEFPLLLAFLQMVGVVKPQGLAKARRYAAVGIVVLVAVITPSGDPISLCVLAAPMYLFYEGSIIFGKIWVRRRARKPAVATAA